MQDFVSRSDEDADVPDGKSVLPAQQHTFHQKVQGFIYLYDEAMAGHFEFELWVGMTLPYIMSSQSSDTADELLIQHILYRLSQTKIISKLLINTYINSNSLCRYNGHEQKMFCTHLYVTDNNKISVMIEVLWFLGWKLICINVVYETRCGGSRAIINLTDFTGRYGDTSN